MIIQKLIAANMKWQLLMAILVKCNREDEPSVVSEIDKANKEYNELKGKLYENNARFNPL